jgi:hypothetical protein
MEFEKDVIKLSLSCRMNIIRLLTNSTIQQSDIDNAIECLEQLRPLVISFKSENVETINS